MHLRKTLILATALALASPAFPAATRGRGSTPSPFDLAPRPVASATGAGAADLAAVQPAVRALRVGGAVAMLDADPAPQAKQVRPAGFTALYEVDEGADEQLQRIAGQRPSLVKNIDGGTVKAVSTSPAAGSTPGSTTPARGNNEIQTENGGDE